MHRRCEGCGTALTGLQRRYCSDICRAAVAGFGSTALDILMAEKALEQLQASMRKPEPRFKRGRSLAEAEEIDEGREWHGATLREQALTGNARPQISHEDPARPSGAG